MYKILVICLVAIVFLLSFINLNPYYDEKEIRLGMSGPFSGSLHTLGDELLLGINAYFKYINEQGGINGRTLRVITKDDKFEPKIAIENTQKFIKKYSVFALIGYIGTPVCKAVMPVVIEHQTPFIGAFSGAQFLRQTPRSPLILNGRTSYVEEIEALIEYFVDEKGYKNIAIFYQNDCFGREGLVRIKRELKKRDMYLVAQGSYKRNTLSVGHALYEISQSRPEVVIMIGATKPVAEFIERAREDKQLKDVKFGTISFVGSRMLLNALDDRVENIIFSQVVPSPWGSLSDEVGHYRKLMDRFNPEKDYSYISLEGYFIARMTVELFRRVGERFTKEDFIDEIGYLYREIEENLGVDESMRLCKCLNNVYLTYYSDGIFWDVHEGE
jgi:ABC-type branched-subunit amino acid transport system substrate-binding protein